MAVMVIPRSRDAHRSTSRLTPSTCDGAGIAVTLLATAPGSGALSLLLAFLKSSFQFNSIALKPFDLNFFKYIDAANVDLKSFSDRFYKEICSAHLDNVLQTLEYLKHETDVWFEITTLLIPGENDSEREINEECAWVIEHLGPDIPLHFSAFHPEWKMMNKPSTPPSTLFKAREIAKSHGLRHVYLGNIHNFNGTSTYCHQCGEILNDVD